MWYDSEEVPVTYVRITGLEAGQESQVFVAYVDCPRDADLTVKADSRYVVRARRTGTADPFVNIAAAPISLRALAGRIGFDIKVFASETIEGFEQVALSPGAVEEIPANWRG